MAAFSNLSSEGLYAPGCKLIIPADRRVALAQFHQDMAIEEYLALGLFPQDIFEIDPTSAIGQALAPEIDRLGEIRFHKTIPHWLKNYANMDIDDLRNVARALLRSDDENYKIPRHPTCEHEAKVSAQHDLFTLLLRFDQEHFIIPAERALASFHQQQISPSTIRAPIWHRDVIEPEENAGVRVYTIRTNGAPEFIIDNTGLLGSKAARLITEIHAYKREHGAESKDLSAEIREAWRSQIVELGLYYRPRTYIVTLFTGMTDHCSFLPEVPMDSSFARLIMAPTRH